MEYTEKFIHCRMPMQESLNYCILHQHYRLINGTLAAVAAKKSQPIRTKKSSGSSNQSLTSLTPENIPYLVSRDTPYHSLMEQAVDGIFVSDANGNYIEVNLAGCRMLGYSRDEILQLNIADVIDPQEIPRIAAEVAHFANGEVVISEWHFRRKDGSLFPGEVRGKQLADGRLQGILIDITQRKQIEKELQDQKTRLTALIEGAMDAIVSIDENQNIVIFNRAAEQMFGYLAADIIQSPIDLLIPVRYRERHRKYTDQFAKTGSSTRSMNMPGQSYGLRANGEEFPFEATISTVVTAGKVISTAIMRDITERKRAEILLLQHKAAIDSAFDGYLILDNQGVVLDANQAYARMSGYSLDELKGMHISRLEAKESQDEIKVRLAKIIALGRDVFETLHIHKDGHELEVEISVTYIRDSGQFVAFYRDITESKKAKRALITSYERFHTLFDRASEGILIVSTSGKILASNHAFARMHGHTPEEMLSMELKDIDPPESRKLIPERMKKLLSEGSLIFEVDNYHKDGHLFPMEVSASVIEVNGELMIQSFCRDITERKRAEKKFKESEERFRVLVENAPEAIVVFDVDKNCFVDANTNAEELFQCSRDELLKSSPLDYLPVHQSDATPIEQGFVEHNKRSLSGEQVVFERLVRGAKGREIMCEVRLTRLPAGKRKLVRASLIDITIRKQVESELRIAAAAFESQEGMLITDAKGTILRVNHAFTETTGYTAEDAVGQTPRILQSGQHNSDFYRAMWKTINQTGAWQGEIWDRRKNGEIYPKWLTITAVKDTTGKTTHYVGSHVDITERKATEEKIQSLAFYDPLTHLPNRRLLQERLRRAFTSSERSKLSGALLFIDLDHFKNINDSLGHIIGDALLQQVALRLLSCVREVDTVARIGGDEFVVMLENLDKDAMEAAVQTEAIAEKILAQLSLPYHEQEHVLNTSASIGIALFNDGSSNTDNLFQQADIAMYQAKKSGRNALRFFDPKMQVSIDARVSMERDLGNAINSAQFLLYYQVQLDSSQQPFGAEALIRWSHPERGFVPPVQFIPLAEETGMILAIGQWVLETACRQLKAWETNELTNKLLLSINVSARQFCQADFVSRILDAVRKYAINPDKLKLELTESMLVDNIEDTIAKMDALKAIGIRLSLDDFGTGYSSLQYLKRLPLNQLKIDQSFVRNLETDPNDQAIVITIIRMALSLGLDVIAEGVETMAQHEFLALQGCQKYQGYLFGKPVPIEQFNASIKQG